MGFADGIAQYGGYEEGTGRVWLDDVSCHGYEDTIFDCDMRRPMGSPGCDHSEDAGVRCYLQGDCPTIIRYKLFNLLTHQTYWDTLRTVCALFIHSCINMVLDGTPCYII